MNFPHVDVNIDLSSVVGYVDASTSSTTRWIYYYNSAPLFEDEQYFIYQAWVQADFPDENYGLHDGAGVTSNYAVGEEPPIGGLYALGAAPSAIVISGETNKHPLPRPDEIANFPKGYITLDGAGALAYHYREERSGRSVANVRFRVLATTKTLENSVVTGRAYDTNGNPLTGGWVLYHRTNTAQSNSNIYTAIDNDGYYSISATASQIVENDDYTLASPAPLKIDMKVIACQRDYYISSCPVYTQVEVGFEEEIVQDLITEITPVNTDVSTPLDVFNMRYGDYGTTFTVINDINMAGFAIPEYAVCNRASMNTEVGASWDGDFDFYGNIEGENHEIQNIAIPAELNDYPSWEQAPLGTIAGGENAFVRNLHLVNVDVKGVYALGAFCVRNGGIIEHCTASGSVEVTQDASWDYGYSGFVLWNYGTVRYCSTTVSVIGDGETGGLCGFNSSSAIIHDCYARGNVSIRHDWSWGYVGGAVGWNEGIVRRVYSTGLVSWYGDQVHGGLVAHNEAGGIVQVSYYDLQTSGVSYEKPEHGYARFTEEMTHPYNEETTYRGWHFGDVVLHDVTNATMGNAFIHTDSVDGWEGLFYPGNVIVVSGFVHAENNGTFTVVGVDGINLFVDATLVPETSTGPVTIEHAAPTVWFIYPDVNNGYPVLVEVPPDGALAATIAAQSDAHVDLATFVKRWYLAASIQAQSQTQAELSALVKSLYLSGAVSAESAVFADLVQFTIELLLAGTISAESYFEIRRQMEMWAKRDGVYEPVEAFAKHDGTYVPVQSLHHKVSGEYTS